ncbi:Peptidoglycan-binding protein ArfA [Planctomycetaceae bacterium]|nr:Peptidoglycan-binding protein ArfA [Planctomycetaceae bacterium]
MKKLLMLAALVAIPAVFSTGCMSDRNRDLQMLDEANASNAALQAENERLEDQVGTLRKQNEDLKTALTNANSKPAPTVDEDALLRKLKEYWDGGNGEWDVIHRGGAVGVRIDDRGVLFKSGSWELTEKTKETLTKLAALIEKKMDATTFVRVDGHTDSDPINKAKGSGIQDNVHLSAMRAMAVRNFLASKGIAADRIFVAGFGEHWPVASNTNPKNKSQNRRVEIFVGTADGLSIGDMPASTSKKTSGDEQASKAPAKPKETVSKK